MKFGLQFFPDIATHEKSARDYFQESLALVDQCDRYGYSHVRIVEHYFHHWGGSSPNPMLFLAAASQRTKTARLITGAVLPAFNHPLKLAGEAGMLDAISGGRLDVGFARAFLPLEFERFGVPMTESVARFDEGIEQVAALLESENVSMAGRFHQFPRVTSLPRPTQLPRPPFYVAATATPASFAKAGRLGHKLMAIPGVGASTPELLGIYRDAWRSAGHPGRGHVMLAVYMVCNQQRDQAHALAKTYVERHLAALVDAVEDYRPDALAGDYAGYDKLIAGLRKQTLETQMDHHAAFVGTPEDLVEQFRELDRWVGGFEEASLQANSGGMPLESALSSVAMFGSGVLPILDADDVRGDV